MFWKNREKYYFLSWKRKLDYYKSADLFYWYEVTIMNQRKEIWIHVCHLPIRCWQLLPRKRLNGHNSQKNRPQAQFFLHVTVTQHSKNAIFPLFTITGKYFMFQNILHLSLFHFTIKLSVTFSGRGVYPPPPPFPLAGMFN